jgi:hypothetical protein
MMGVSRRTMSPIVINGAVVGSSAVADILPSRAKTRASFDFDDQQGIAGPVVYPGAVSSPPQGR